MKSGRIEVLGVFLAILLTIGGLAIGLSIARGHQNGLVEKTRAVRTAQWLAGGALVVRLVDQVPVANADAPIWGEAPVHEVRVQRQAITMPVLADSTIGAVYVQALTDGRSISWRLTWEDRTLDANVDTGRFTDAVALQFPVSADASFMMGGADQVVQILHWKGLWQKDVDEGFQDVQDLHPNYWTDLYWFAEAGGLPRVPDSFRDERSLQWFAGHQAGNPMSRFERIEPVEEAIAAGFGTLTHQETSATVGRGVWRDGTWTVVMTRPLRTEDPLDYQFSRGMTGSVAVAVWDGGAGNVGGRKHYSEWIEFRVEAIS